MSVPYEALRERLRGSLPAKGPGARGIERMARNPECKRLASLLLAGTSPKAAAEHIYEEEAKEGQSPFALFAGERAEKVLLENGASVLLDLYRKAQRLSLLECKVASLSDLAPGSRPRDLALRRAETERLLRLKLAGDERAPNLILKPRLLLNLAGELCEIEPDALVASDGEAFYRPVEIKSYTDRGSKTNAADLRGARRQTAVGVVALRHTLQRLGVEGADSLVAAQGDLVFHVPESFRPSLRPTTLEGEVESIERVLEGLPSLLQFLAQILPDSASLEDLAVLRAIPSHYTPDCREHCALAKHCRREALSCGSLALLGESAREHLAAAGTLPRALELLQSTSSGTREEKELAKELQEVLQQLQKAVGHG